MRNDIRDRLQAMSRLLSEAEHFGEAEQTTLFRGKGYPKVSGAVAAYRSLNDAADATGISGLEKGSTEIWYGKPDYTRCLMMGPDWLAKHGIMNRIGKQNLPMPTADTLSRTHILLGKVKETNPERIYMMMQGDSWSPHGEARGLISSKGLEHTSMSMGDVAVVGGRALMVDHFGFQKLD